jgi:hypothetical protein
MPLPVPVNNKNVFVLMAKLPTRFSDAVPLHEADMARHQSAVYSRTLSQ